MEPVGYRNANEVLRLSEEGRFLVSFRGNPTQNFTAFSMLITMAEKTYDWPPTSDNRARHLPSRVYELGWDYLVKKFSMGLVDSDTLYQSDDIDRLVELRHQSALNRISKAASFLQQQGLIKKIRKENVRKEIPAAWLLLLGDDAENREVEAYARECLRL